jgi:hypothetical protein
MVRGRGVAYERRKQIEEQLKANTDWDMEEFASNPPPWVGVPLNLDYTRMGMPL